jgi:hypothetical protein
MQLHVTRKLLSVFLTLRITFVCLQVHSETESSCTRCHFTFVFPSAGTKSSYSLLSPTWYFDLPMHCSECSSPKFVCPLLPLGPFSLLSYSFYLERPSHTINRYGGGWLRRCATSRKVAGSIPDGVIQIFHWHNLFGRTMALGLTQLLTEMSTRNISWG